MSQLARATMVSSRQTRRESRRGQGKVVRIKPKNSSCVPFFRKEVEYTQILREKNKELTKRQRL